MTTEATAPEAGGIIPWPGSEADLCAMFIAWLRSRKNSQGKILYDVHQEVKPVGGGCAPGDTIDIVTISVGGDVGIIEAKLKFGPDVIGQAHSRFKFAEFRSILTPEPSQAVQRGRGHKAMLDTCRQYGLGVFFARLVPETGMVQFLRIVKPVHNKKAYTDPITNVLGEATRQFNRAGMAGGRRFDNGQSKWDRLREYCKINMGPTCKEVKAFLDLSPDEYREMLKAARASKIAGIYITNTAGLTRFWTEENKP